MICVRAGRWCRRGLLHLDPRDLTAVRRDGTPVLPAPKERAECLGRRVSSSTSRGAVAPAMRRRRRHRLGRGSLAAARRSGHNSGRHRVTMILLNSRFPARIHPVQLPGAPVQLSCRLVQLSEQVVEFGEVCPVGASAYRWGSAAPAVSPPWVCGPPTRRIDPVGSTRRPQLPSHRRFATQPVGQGICARPQLSRWMFCHPRIASCRTDPFPGCLFGEIVGRGHEPLSALGADSPGARRRRCTSSGRQVRRCAGAGRARPGR